MSNSSLLPDVAGSEAVKDVRAATFKADVLEASSKALVLVDFGTPRDSLCAQMTASLEKIARASKGAVRLAKVDIDRDLAIAQQLGVRSAPSVFAFHKGRPVDGFSGSIPEAQVKAWVDELLKATGASVGHADGMDAAFKQAAELLDGGDIATANAIYADILDAEPENAKAYAGSVNCLLRSGQIDLARAMLDAAPAAVAKDAALDSVRAAVELAEQAVQSKGQTEKLEAALTQNPADHQARFDLALAYYASGRREEAVDCLLEIVRRGRSWNDDAARKQLVKFFEAMGATDSLTVSARRRLSSLLFA
ncbi:MAG: tetratricopeptide repeat protein [Alphaproteobacteria bacterium]|nr:tetratricopeptide repeat protein [Alphaproteobacteria bacterium]